MNYDTYKDYTERQRRYRRYDSLVPVFVVAAVMLVAFYAFFVAHQRSHAKPKPKPKPAAQMVQQVGNVSTVWLPCNAGMEVTDLRDCPEYRMLDRKHAHD